MQLCRCLSLDLFYGCFCWSFSGCPKSPVCLSPLSMLRLAVIAVGQVVACLWESIYCPVGWSPFCWILVSNMILVKSVCGELDHCCCWSVVCVCLYRYAACMIRAKTFDICRSHRSLDGYSTMSGLHVGWIFFELRVRLKRHLNSRLYVWHSDRVPTCPWKFLSLFVRFSRPGKWKILKKRQDPQKSSNLYQKVLENAWIWCSNKVCLLFNTWLISGIIAFNDSYLCI